MVSSSEHFLLLRVDDGINDFLCGFVYAKCTMVERRVLWEQLNSQVLGNEPCLIAGDFKIIREDSERRGGRRRLRATIDEFNSWINQCGLIEMKSMGRWFSWYNGV